MAINYHILKHIVPCIFYITPFCMFQSPKFIKHKETDIQNILYEQFFLSHSFKIRSSICRKIQSVNRILLIKEFLSLLKEGKSTNVGFCYFFYFLFVAYTIFMLSNYNNSFNILNIFLAHHGGTLRTFAFFFCSLAAH